MFTLGASFVLLLFAFAFDAGELSWTSRYVNYFRFLEKEGFECKTKSREYEHKNHTYTYRECSCMKGAKFGKCIGIRLNFAKKLRVRMGNREFGIHQS